MYNIFYRLKEDQLGPHKRAPGFEEPARGDTDLAVEGILQQLHHITALDACVLEAFHPFYERPAVARRLLQGEAEAEPQHKLLLSLRIPAFQSITQY